MNFIKCREINGKRYSTADTYIECDGNFYKSYILPVNLSMILFITIIIPFAITVVLYKNKENSKMKHVNIQRKYGILYLEFSEKNYLWELISILQVKSISFIIIIKIIFVFLI